MISPKDILSDNGPLADLIPDYRERPQQIEMAEEIAEALADQESLVCEAGTGTGKTFAYLIPAILSGMKVIISTGTKHLQDQLYNRDLRIIQQAIGQALHTALLKGRANYLCLQRMHSMESDPGGMNRGYLAQLGAVRSWSQQTDNGDLAELTTIPEDAGVRNFITSTTENCLGQACDYFEDCFVFKARRRAADADLTVVNHHLLLADMALRERGYGELLPVVDCVIFDEAHQLPDLASQFFSENLSSNQFLELIRDCKQAYLSEAADMPDFMSLLDKLETSVRQLRLSFSEYDTRIAWHRCKDKQNVAEAMECVHGHCMDLHQMLEDFSNRGKELDNCYNRCSALMDKLEMFIETSGNDIFIQWLETRGKGFLLHQTPLDIADSFQERLREYDCTAIYTSATLAVKGDFKHFAAQLGLSDAKQLSWQSPFDFKRQTMLYLPEGLPDPRDEAYTSRVLEAAIPVLKYTRGRAFLLFTSYRALYLAAESIHSHIEFPVFVQGESPRTELLETFRDTPHSVLLGTQSFWEGVDVKGQALSCVIIDKLPFAAPDDPVLQARLKKLEEQGGNPFMEYQLPEAVINLKQGVGRLIRDERDYGVLMICDPRLTGKSYGRVFLNSLPEMQQSRELAAVEAFFHRHETESMN